MIRRWVRALDVQGLTRLGVVVVIALYLLIGAVLALALGASPARVASTIVQLLLAGGALAAFVAIVRAERRRRRDEHRDRALALEIRRALR